MDPVDLSSTLVGGSEVHFAVDSNALAAPRQSWQAGPIHLRQPAPTFLNSILLDFQPAHHWYWHCAICKCHPNHLVSLQPQISHFFKPGTQPGALVDTVYLQLLLSLHSVVCPMRTKMRTKMLSCLLLPLDPTSSSKGLRLMHNSCCFHNS